MTTKLCTHVYPNIIIAMATLHIRNQWQLASGNEYVFSLLQYCTRVIDLRTHVEPTSMVAMVTVNNPPLLFIT